MPDLKCSAGGAEKGIREKDTLWGFFLFFFLGRTKCFLVLNFERNFSDGTW